jgi:lipopolysaccharide export system protein LptA
VRKKIQLGSCLTLLFFVFSIQVNFAQAPSKTNPPQNSEPAADTTSDGFIHIRYADELNYLATGKDTLQKLIGHVELNQDTVFLFCDSAIILNSVDMVAQGNFIMQQGDSTTIFADSAEYSSETKIADLYSNVSMVKGQQKLFTDYLTYDSESKIATYLTGATLTDDTTFLKSTRGYFHAKTDDIFFKDSVVVVNPDFTLRSDTLKFNARTKKVTFLAPTLIVQDTARIYTESGFYDINKKYAEFNKNPQYVKNDQKAWSNRMTYDGNKEEVTLIGDAHFEDSVSIASAEVIRHNEKTGVTVLEGNAFFQDKDRTLTGDTITYDSKNETYSTRGRSHIVDSEQILDADRVDYLKEREVGIATGNVIFTDTLEKMTVFCEYAEHSKKRDFLKAYGGRDSLGQPARPLLIKVIDGDSLFISADTLMSFVPVDSAKSTKNDGQRLTSTEPLIDISRPDSLQEDTVFSERFLKITKGQSLDSVQMAVRDSLQLDTMILADSSLVQILQKPLDTIPSDVQQEMEKENGEITELIDRPDLEPIDDPVDTTATPLLDLLGDLDFEEDQTLNVEPAKNRGKDKKEERLILAFKDVRIFKSDLQAICDSLSYSSLDSTFRLFRKPIIWSDTSQFTAEHIRIQLADGAIDKIFMDEKSFIVNTPDELFFNQIKGRNSIAYFDSSELRHVRVVGNAESVYYALDDAEAYIGVNKTVCSEMKIIFGNNEVEGIVFYDKPSANLYPMKEADHDGLKMEGFSWQLEKRPNSVEDLIKLKKRPKQVISVPVPIENEPTDEAENLDEPIKKDKKDKLGTGK